MLYQPEDSNGAAAEDFTLDGYRRLLVETKRLYPIAGFEVLDEPDIATAAGGSFCIVRHDIDISPDLAVAMAEVEHGLGVRATYAVLLTGAFYNAFESRTRAKLRKLAEFGHDLALHFDAAWHGIDNVTDLEAAIRDELAMLESLLPGVPIRTFAFHNPDDFALSCKDRSYGGLRNTYAGELAAHLAYVSDSNGYWRFKSWQHMLEDRPDRLQVLTHPEWWTVEAKSPAERICGHIDSHAREVWNHYCDHLRLCGRENRSDVPAAMETLVLGSPEDRAILQLWLTGYRTEAVRRLSQLCTDMKSPAEDRSALAATFDRLAQSRARFRRVR